MPVIIAALLTDPDGEGTSVLLWLTLSLAAVAWLSLSAHGGKRRKREARLELALASLRGEMAFAGHMARIRVDAFNAAPTDAEKVSLVQRALLWTGEPIPSSRPPLPPVDLLVAHRSGAQ
jgi:hypothetical protein